MLGIIHYTTPLFLIQLANATNQQVLEKILEAAGIGLTLGTGALAGLGFEASVAARVLLWADRAAFVLGTLTSVLREHRSWLVETFGSSFMDAVDTVHSACAIYGIARVAIEAPRMILAVRNGYRALRDVVRARSSGFSQSEQATVQSVTQSTDELLQQVDQIQGARGPTARQGEGNPNTVLGESSGRPFDPSQAGGPIRSLSTSQVRITARGVEVVERHLARFGQDSANAVMIDRLRRIATGELEATAVDLNFYTHELREFVRFRQLGHATGDPGYDVWNNAHTATLEDYGLNELSTPDPLYHPDARAPR